MTEHEGGPGGPGGGTRRGTARYSVPEAARALGISERAVRKRITAGTLDAEKAGTAAAPRAVPAAPEEPGAVPSTATGAGFGVTAGPDAPVNGVDRLTIGHRVPRQQRAQGLHIEVTLGHCVIEAAPATAVCGLQAEVGQRRDRLDRQHGVDKLKQGISLSTEGVVQGQAEGAESSEVMSGHPAQLARTTGRGRCRRAPRSPPA